MPTIPFEMCPIKASLGVLGRKWSLILLRDLAFVGIDRFSGFIDNNPGLTPRVLSRRLQELREEGIVTRIVDPDDDRSVTYELSERGRDAVPILTAFIAYGIRHHAGEVFADAQPRDLPEVFPMLAPRA